MRSKTRIARALRRKETPAEKRLWSFLRGGKLDGLKFRRQHPIDRWYVDFACEQARLVVELDGGVHRLDGQAERDEARTAAIEACGWHVLRLTNEAALFDTWAVLDAVRDAAKLAGVVNPHPPVHFVNGPLPLPQGEG